MLGKGVLVKGVAYLPTMAMAINQRQRLSPLLVDGINVFLRKATSNKWDRIHIHVPPRLLILIH